MKILILALLCAFTISVSVRPPSPICRVSPLPSIIPVSIGETVRVDLENMFDGFNLFFEAQKYKDHISVTHKYSVNDSSFSESFNFTSAKIKDHNRFVGLSTKGDSSYLSIGMNHPESGVVINKTIKVEDKSNLVCFDVDEIYDLTTLKAYAIIDCGRFEEGKIKENEFLYVNLDTGEIHNGTQTTDIFAEFDQVTARNIEVILDPIIHVVYVLRFYTAEGVDDAHKHETYAELFMLNDEVHKLQIVDVIDHTLLNLPSLSILDYQVHLGIIYLLVENSGLYQIRFTPTQRLVRQAHFPIKMNVRRFRVIQDGFNDDLHVVFSNENTVYRYEWDAVYEPILVTKYTLMSGSQVDELHMDDDFVIIQATAVVDEKKERRLWIFSRRTLSYTHAFGSFVVPTTGPSILLYENFEQSLHIIQADKSTNVRLSLPYLEITPLAGQKPGDKEEFLVKAISQVSETNRTECRLTFNFLYLENNSTEIIKTGLQMRSQMLVDAPDEMELELEYEFFGRNLSYETSFVVNKTDPNATIPEAYTEKRVKAPLDFPPAIDQTKIVFSEFFTEDSLDETKDKNKVYGIVQVEEKVGENSTYPIYYLLCETTIDSEFINPSVRCRVTSKSNFNKGRISIMSQMYSTSEKIGAIVFEDKDDQGQISDIVELYYFSPQQLLPYGSIKFGVSLGERMTGVSITMNGLVMFTFEYAKKIEVYRLTDLHSSMSEPKPKPIMTIDHNVLRFFGVEYFAPIETKVSIYHYEVIFIRSKNGVMAMNINRQGIPELLFFIKTETPLFDFEVNRDTLLLITHADMSLYRLTRPLRRSNPPFLLQKYTSDFNINEYDEINSDGLFYLVEKEDNMLLVVHPNMPSTSVIYSELYIGNIKSIDAAKLNDKEVLFVYNGTTMMTYMFAENPKLKLKWEPEQTNFTFHLTAKNEKARSENYTTNISVIESNEAIIQKTEYFNETQVRKLGHRQIEKNQRKVDLNITLNDSAWFTGNVMHYSAKCKDCHGGDDPNQVSVELQNHVKQLDKQIHVGETAYDMHSTFSGIFGQQYRSIFKTHGHNDSLEYILKIPTQFDGEACTKMAVHGDQDYLLSFCEGEFVNVYITTFTSFKPFTYGPFETEAKVVSHAKVVGNIVMIVDTEDNPFTRAGGIYLYYIDFSAEVLEDMFNMLDYLDHDDLQIEGFRGIPYIGSADIHKPLFNKNEYSVFLTEGRTGNLFVFVFEVSHNKQEAIYLQRRLIDLRERIPENAPRPLRVLNVNILDWAVKTEANKTKIEYQLLFTVKNWHHFEVEIIFDNDYDMLSFSFERLYERVPYPWQLNNYVVVKSGHLNASYFAVAYKDYTAETGAQLMAIYEIPAYHINKTEEKNKDLEDGIPITRMLGAHRVLDSGDICFAFNQRDEHRLYFNDVLESNVIELELNKELKIVVKNAPPVIESENITIIAQNHYTNVSFIVELSFTQTPDVDPDPTKLENIIWIIILVIGLIMIIGLVFVWSRQSRKKPEARDSIKESLLTVEPEFKNNYINRSSADPESARGTVDYTTPTPTGTVVVKEEKKVELQKEIIEERKEVEVDNPLEERIEPPKTEESLDKL